jgi:hypothetical protein
MGPSLARYSAPVSFVHAPSLAAHDFITIIVGFKFSVHTGRTRSVNKYFVAHGFGIALQKQFQEFTFGRDKNLIDLQMKFGNPIQRARLEKSEVDEDDDKIVFELEPDPGAMPLRNPKE